MTEKVNKDQKNLPTAPESKRKKHPKWSKKLIITACICVGLLVGAGATYGVMESHEHGGLVEAVHHQKANKADIKVDQQAAIDKFHQKYKGKQINEVELEADHGQYVYKVKGFDKTNEYKVKVNSKDGKVISNKKEKLEAGEKKYQLAPEKAISRAEASSIAEKAAKKGSSVEWKLEQTGKDKSVWEVKVASGSQEKEVTINASSKKVLSVENDH